MGDLIRVFIAAELPETVHQALARVQAELRAQRFRFRWVAPENIHLTLNFLGDVAPAMLAPISDAMAMAARNHTSIHLAVKALGVFPSIKRVRVIWAGLAEEVTRLGALKVALDQSLLAVSGLGFQPEQRPYKAHLTIGRAKGPTGGRKLALVMDELQAVLDARFSIDTIYLFKSDLRPEGAVYTKLSSAHLG